MDALSLSQLKVQVKAHDWGSEYARALCDRIEIVRLLASLDLKEIREILGAIRSDEHRAIAMQLTQVFILNKERNQ